MVVGLPVVHHGDKMCEACIFGKQHRTPFPAGKSWRANQPLMLVHADICGPMRTNSLGDSKYFLIFVDDYTRMKLFHAFYNFEHMLKNKVGSY